MKRAFLHVRTRRARPASASLALVCAAALCALALALAPGAVGDTTSAPSLAALAPAAVPGEAGQGAPASAKPGFAAATLEQCATATAPQTERSATFSGEMTAVPGTVRMQLRIALEERPTIDVRYRTVAAPGLGVWHGSNPGVKIFTHIQQVTNLSAPAFYRAVISFRWLDAYGHVIKSSQLHTASCEQPAAPAPASTGGASSSSG